LGIKKQGAENEEKQLIDHTDVTLPNGRNTVGPGAFGNGSNYPFCTGTG
jgi:hypothetical protein